MAKKGAARLTAGSNVRIRDGVTLPEFPDVPIGGWTGTIAETRGRGADMQFIIQWDAPTIDGMPQAYLDHCEDHGLFHEMVCLSKNDVEGLE